jgi:F-type H+-transporting ATPase subunit gamma
MATLKDLRLRIRSVRSTQKITSAMKMVAASRLRRAQEQAEAARPYAMRMERMVGSLAANLRGLATASPLLAGTGADAVHLLVVACSDRGLAGGFNASILRQARRTIRELQGAGKTVKLFVIGRKGRDALRRDHARLIIESLTDLGRPRLTFEVAQRVATRIIERFAAGEFDHATIVYNRFRSAISQIVTTQAFIPFAAPAPAAATPAAAAATPGAIYEFEPDEEDILRDLLPRALAVQLFTALLENAASEQGARMTAMDNATRNAGEMIDDLTITYNRTRQAAITKELIEIISGAEAL